MIVRDCIKRALRMLNAISSGVDPTSDEAADALQAFQNMILSLPAIGQGDQWHDLIVTANATAGEDQRITCADGITITLPTQVPIWGGVGCVNPTTWSGCFRPPRDGARVQVVQPAGSQMSFWCADVGAWVRADNLTLQSAVPFNASLKGGLSAMLALEIAPEYGPDPSQLVGQMAARARRDINARLRARVVTPADPSMTRTTNTPWVPGYSGGYVGP